MCQNVIIYIVASKGSNIYVHDLNTGDLKLIFSGNGHYESHEG